MELSGKQAIEAIAETRHHENDQRQQIMPVYEMDHDEGNENHPQQSELVGSREDLRELHAGSSEASELCRLLASTLEGVRAWDGSSPVLEKNRCEREGRLPSGRSSSTRSRRCMGKKTTAGVNGSPSRTITARSSKEASSAPLRLRPSGARARIIPQNFSRGLLRVAITSAPGTNSSRAPDKAVPLLETRFCARFSTVRLSPGDARIANQSTPYE